MSTREIVNAVFALSDPGESDKLIPLFPAPSASNGGGITILAAWAVNGTATTGTTSHTLTLANLGATGAVNGGTIAAAIGGSADHWVEKTPKAFTIDATERYVDAGEWVGLRYLEHTAGTFTNPASVVVQYVMGN